MVVFVCFSEKFMVRLNKNGGPKNPEKVDRLCALFTVTHTLHGVRPVCWRSLRRRTGGGVKEVKVGPHCPLLPFGGMFSSNHVAQQNSTTCARVFRHHVSLRFGQKLQQNEDCSNPAQGNTV